MNNTDSIKATDSVKTAQSIKTTQGIKIADSFAEVNGCTLTCTYKVQNLEDVEINDEVTYILEFIDLDDRSESKYVIVSPLCGLVPRDCFFIEDYDYHDLLKSGIITEDIVEAHNTIDDWICDPGALLESKENIQGLIDDLKIAYNFKFKGEE